MQHLMRSTALADRPDGVGSLARARASHPAGSARPAAPSMRVVAPGLVASLDVADAARPVGVGGQGLVDEEGSLVTEYGLLAMVAATVAAVVITWASGGALVTLSKGCCGRPAPSSAREPHHPGGPVERRAPEPRRRSSRSSTAPASRFPFWLVV
jgi:hypothetical protein